jgi:itaconate CoA-transferase
MNKMLDSNPRAGDPLPPLWHWFTLPDHPAHADLLVLGALATGAHRGARRRRLHQARFCERFLGRPDLSDDPNYVGNANRNANRRARGEIIVARFKELTGAEAAAALLEAVPMAHANVNTMAEVWTHPQLAARGRSHHVATPAGTIPALAQPGLTDPTSRMDPIPALGEHTRPILAELGLSPEDIDALVEDGVV